MHELTASQIILELANRGEHALERWEDFPRDKELGAGVNDVRPSKFVND